MFREVNNVIFTDHAMERALQRNISQDMIVAAINSPDDQFKEDDQDTRFIKNFEKRPVHVVAAYQNDEQKWLVKSVWVRGEDDMSQPIWRRILALVFSFLQKFLKSQKSTTRSSTRTSSTPKSTRSTSSSTKSSSGNRTKKSTTSAKKSRR